MFRLAILFILALPMAAFCQDARQPATARNVKQFVDRCESLRQGTIAHLEHRLRGLKSGQIKVHHPGRRINKIEEEVNALRSGEAMVIPSLSFPPEVSAIGSAPGNGAHVEQVLGENEMLVTCYFLETIAEVTNGRPVVRRLSLPTVCLIRGVPTGDVWEGMDLSLPQTFEITSKHTYQTVEGRTNKVPVLEPFDMRKAEPYRRMLAGK